MKPLDYRNHILHGRVDVKRQGLKVADSSTANVS